MKYLLLYGCEAVTAAIPFLAVCLLRKRAAARVPLTLLAVFAVYLFGVFHVTEPGTIFDLLRHPPELRADFINLLPFSDPELDRLACQLNVLLFVPLGFLLPLGWAQYQRLRYTAGFGFCFSLLIELSQLLNHRRTDIDDLILNTLGAVIGLCAFRLFRRLRKWPDKPFSTAAYEPVLYTAALFLFRFFTYNEFGAAKWIFGF